MTLIDDTKQIRCTEHAEMAHKVNEMHTALLGDMTTMGWLSRIQRMDDALKFVGRALWAGLGVFFLGVCGFLWAVLTNNIEIVTR